MTTGALLRTLGVLHRGATRPAYRQGAQRALSKDFSPLPVCGSVRPLAEQRARRQPAR